MLRRGAGNMSADPSPGKKKARCAVVVSVIRDYRARGGLSKINLTGAAAQR